MLEMEQKEYVHIKYANIPQEFHDKYGLSDASPLVRHVWVYFIIVRGAYGLPQSDKLVHDLLRKHLNAAGYREAPTTPGRWHHDWRPVQFVLIVNNLGVAYVGCSMRPPPRSSQPALQNIGGLGGKQVC